MVDEKVRIRIFSALWARLKILEPYKPAMQRLVLSGLVPLNTPRAGKLLWGTCDRIWYWAGDSSTDFNHYTKRALLLTILTSSTLYWLKDDSMDHCKTQQFIHSAIEKVMMIPKLKSQAAECLKAIPIVGKIFQ
jgi:ubiquinone biosynthesis protein COQ9